MQPRDIGDGGREVLVQGGEEPAPRPGLRAAGVAALLLAVGAAGGVGAARTPPGLGADSDRFPVVAGAMRRAAEGDFGPGLLVSLHNGGGSPVRVLNVAPHGWDGSAPSTTLPPNGWVELPLDVDVDCASTPAATDQLDLRTAAAGGPESHVVRLATVPRVLVEERNRVCPRERGSIPSVRDLSGIWILDKAGWLTARLLIQLNHDHTFAMDLADKLFSDHPAAVGRYTLTGDRLDLNFRGGELCRNGDRASCQVRILADGRLRIRHLDHDSSCSMDEGVVWFAHRITEGPAPAALHITPSRR